MRLFGATMVRNEADIVEAFVRHNLTVLDGLAIVDHGSFDGTSEILAALVAEGLPLTVVRNDRVGYFQEEITTGLVRQVFSETDADFVFVLDGDEFLKVPSRPLLERVLSSVPAGLHAVINWQTYVPDFAVPAGDVIGIVRGARRLAEERHGLHKVVVARCIVDTPQATIGTGNHIVLPAGKSEPEKTARHARLSTDVVAVAHLPIRSAEQYTAKVAINRLGRLAAKTEDQEIGFHMREAYEDIRAGRPCTPEFLAATAVNYSARRADWIPAKSVMLVADPFLADIRLRYTRPAAMNPLSLIIRFAERLAAAATA